MGKRDLERENIENISPVNKAHRTSNHTSDNMKTRSGKALSKSSKAKAIPPAPNPVKYPTAVLLQEIATSASSVDEKPGKSPLSESHSNEHTPEKTQTSPEPLKHNEPTTSATPTANLKVLCDAVDHDETVSSESSAVHTITGDEPVTPTTNLKMLITAASPEIRSLELSKSRLFTDDDEEDDDEFADDTAEQIALSKKSSKAAAAATRKQKSLGILCRRFMSQFDENPPQTSRIEVCLDELASHLGTERRRIYDIVNVLESVEIMSRRAKNRYLWHGKTNLNATLVKLKYFAESERVAKQLELVRELEVTRLYGRKMKDGNVQTEDEAVAEHPKYKQYMQLFGDANRKERSLGVMSQKFLMLFLTGRTKTINLDMAAKILLGDPMVETRQTNSQFKTKIRRLYDIANILASINLVCKVHVTELRGRKPAFSYIGPDVEELASLDEYQYLKGVEVARPGRTTLDMKMEELKRKMDAHIAAEHSNPEPKQVPPVTVQAPDLEQIKLVKASGREESLSQLAGEHAAAKKDKQRSIAPALASNKPFVVIQGMAGGATSVVTTTKIPTFMDNPQQATSTTSTASTSAANSSTPTTQEQYSTISLLPVIHGDGGNQYIVAAPFQQSPVSVSLLNTSPAAGSASGMRHILPSSSATTQTLTLYTPPSQQKRPASELSTDSPTAHIAGNAVFITKDNQNYVLLKKAKTDNEASQESLEGGSTSEEPLAGSIVKVKKASETVSAQLTGTPLPVVYSTPSGLHTVANGANVKPAQGISGTQITFLASPITTPLGTPVTENRTETGVAVPATSKGRTAIRQLLLSPK